MGTTLENGVYLPSEGERNCYAGLKTNWEILDQKVADVTALQQAVAGALHREIVESLPTTDIDPNTIYMVLSGTSATENVYNEFMYVNNAWELIGTSATDLTNYYTKSEVDGKLLLKASASDLTSHTGDATIHVTTADKNKWNNGVTQSYVLRYSSASVTDNSTIAFSTLDNIDNIKANDKIIDVDGKIFSVVSVDTANQTVTVGSALIDLALDANVVHKSGDETIGGKKTFRDDLTIYNYDSSQSTKNLNISSSKIQVGDTSNSDAFGIRFNAGASYIAQILAVNDTTGTQNLQLGIRTKDGSDNFITSMVRSRLFANGNSSFEPGANDSISLGSSVFKWKSVYATNYYYGSNNVEFSTKFVTTDTAQTISGAKTFSSDITLQGTTTPVIKTISNIVQDSTGGNESISWVIRDKTDSNTVFAQSVNKFSGQNVDWRLDVTSILNGTSATRGIRLVVDPANESYYLGSSGNNTVTLGTSTNKWKDCQTYLINGLTPSSLGMPTDNASNIIDISSYISALDGTLSSYTVPANGWISINVVGTAIAIVSSRWSDSRLKESSGNVRMLYPVLKNETLGISVTGTTLAYARFIPCQGNV